MDSGKPESVDANRREPSPHPSRAMPNGASPLSSSSSSSLNSTQKEDTRSFSSMGIRTGIGLMVCFLSYLALQHAIAPLIPFFPEIPLDVSSSMFMSRSQQFYTLVVLAGYLSLDLLFLNPNGTLQSSAQLKSMSSNSATSGPSLDEMEDFMTFVFICGVLWKVDDIKLQEFDGILYALITKISMKLVWHATLFFYERSRNQSNTINEVKTSSIKTKIQLSDKAMAMALKQSVEHEEMDRDAVTNNLWIIHNQTYDLSEFVDRHPGGRESILLGRGRDCTALFESYHPFTHQHRLVLQKYRCRREVKGQGHVSDDPPGLADVGNGPKDTSGSDDGQKYDDPFYNLLKQRVTAALMERGIDPILDRGATLTRCIYYALIFFAWVVTVYAHIKGSILGSFLFAIFGWFMGALGHDAGHFAVSRNAWINEWGVWAMSLICNPILWQHQHTYGHHSFTNEFDHDPDLHHFNKFIRVHRKFKYVSLYKYQSEWFYVMFAYLFVVFGTCFWIPWGMIETGTLYDVVSFQDKDRPIKAWSIRFHMAMYMLVIMIVPMFTATSMWRAVFASYLHVATLGIVFALFSQINHLTETALHSDMDNRKRKAASEHSLGGGRGQTSGNQRNQHNVDVTAQTMSSKSTTPSKLDLETSWAAAQIETSNNFASQSLLWHVLSNGLNHQIEHHLFPGLNHCHLHHIAPVVRKACEEYGVNYKSYDTWQSLLEATLEWLEKLSVDEESSTCPDGN